MDVIQASIAIVLLRWEEAANAPSNVVYLDDYRRLRWMRKHTRPMLPPSGDAA